MNALFAFIKKLMTDRFYGALIIKFQAGKITFLEIRKTEDAGQFN
jgi:hypothetical protein